ncbi:MORN repeat, putative [Angomonas deanei]|uniref:MORN repeat, putative n=1 Tax=Angomonas deanei TaxID=59799 RepID=A0A7G2C0C5_9TRYP|nr:MORN repeat, putative [Angomonas deanei]
MEQDAGINVYDNGTVYEGRFVNGKRDGLGVVYYPNGNIFVGEFDAGEMEGPGTVFFASGDYFVGTFKNSGIHEGVLYTDGRELKGRWENGVQLSEESVASSPAAQAAHFHLFSTVIKQVHLHFRNYKDNPFHSNSVSSVPPIVPQINAPPVSADRNQYEDSDLDGRYTGQRVRPRLSTAADKPPPREKNLREELTRSAPVETVFACAGPSSRETFSYPLFIKRTFAFLFPFLALPVCPISPCKVTSLSQERDYVVSGATLRQDFDSPKWSFYFILLAFLCQIASIVLVACKVKLGTAQEGQLTLPEMVIPCVLWLFLSLFCGSYNSFIQTPHSLERLDRNLTPKLSAFAASVVDSRASVCINTWDEEGRSKVRNNHYRFRWLFFAVLYGAMMSLSAPSTRGGFGHGMFGSGGFEKAAALCAFFSTFLFCSIITYFILKLTDMEREIRAKLKVLTEIAFIEQKSIINPNIRAKQPFNVDEAFCVSDIFKGFCGWFVTRSIVLYASTCANHAARSGAMGVFTVSMIAVCIVSLADVFYMLANHYDESNQYYSTAHSYALFVLFFWGILLVRYMSSCVLTKLEFKRQLYIMDVVGLYHEITLHDEKAGSTITKCRLMAATHDAEPSLFGLRYYPLVLVAILFFIIASLAAIAFQLGEVIYY